MKLKKINNFTMLPPAPDTCQECGIKHSPEQPHDATSLCYQYSFYADHGRWPDWRDAIAHCSDEIKAVWIDELKIRGLWKESLRKGDNN